MADKDPAKTVADSYAAGMNAYAKNQTVQGMAAAQVADAAVKPQTPEDERSALHKKMLSGVALTPEESARYNQLLAMAKVKPVPTGEERDALKKKVMDKTASPEEMARYNELLATKIEAPAPVKPLSLQEQRTAQGIGPNGLPLEDPNAIPIKRETTAPMGTREWFLAQGVGPNGIPAGDIPVETLAPLKQPFVQPNVDAISAASPIARKEPEAAPAAPAIEAPAVAVTPKAEAPKKSAVDAIIEGMKAETADEKGPNIWDIIQAAAAGWNFQTPAYLERKKAKETKTSQLEELSKRAQFERELQKERIEMEAEANAKKLQAQYEYEARLAGLGGTGGIAPLSPGQALAQKGMKLWNQK